MHRSTLPFLIALTFLSPASHADSTIDPAPGNRHSYAANTGWADWNWEPAAPGGGRGATVTSYTLSGRIYHANLGWIDLGDGSPADGVHYANATVAGQPDFGVNHEGGALSGMAYGANIGWIQFAQSWPSPPRIDLQTGAFSGLAYCAQCGWIDLGQNGPAGVVTRKLASTPDSDADGIEDAWEFEQVIAAGKATGSPAGDLTLLAADGSDSDCDGISDVAEFIADTNPFDPGDRPEILSITRDTAAQTADLVWRSSPRRIYDITSSTDLKLWTLDQIGLTPDAGHSTLRATDDATGERRFWSIDAKLPLP